MSKHTAEQSAPPKLAIDQLRAEVREWLCEKCNTVYPGPPTDRFDCVICPGCGGSTGPRLTIEIRQLVDQVAGMKAHLERQLREANASVDMYANAWQREIAAFDGTIRRKGHHIDALVLTTRDLVQRCRTVQAALVAKLAAPDCGLYVFTRAELEALIAGGQA